MEGSARHGALQTEFRQGSNTRRSVAGRQVRDERSELCQIQTRLHSPMQLLAASPRQPDRPARHAGDRCAGASSRTLKDIAVATGPDAGKVAGLVLKTRSGLLHCPFAGGDGDPRRHARTALLLRALVPLKDDGNYLYLQQDLVDRQIIDIHGRKVVRVNDVELEWMGQGAAHLLARRRSGGRLAGRGAARVQRPAAPGQTRRRSPAGLPPAASPGSSST